MDQNRETIVLSDQAENPAGVDYHYQTGKIFWADPGHAKVRINTDHISKC